MTIAMLGLVNIAGCAAAWLLCRDAVEGFEDAAGFHPVDRSACEDVRAARIAVRISQ